MYHCLLCEMDKRSSCWEGKAFPSLQPRPRPYNHAHSSKSGRFLYNPPRSGLPLPLRLVAPPLKPRIVVDAGLFLFS